MKTVHNLIALMKSDLFEIFTSEREKIDFNVFHDSRKYFQENKNGWNLNRTSTSCMPYTLFSPKIFPSKMQHENVFQPIKPNGLKCSNLSTSDIV